MKSLSALLIFASVLVVGCAGSSPLSPDSASVSSARSLVSATPAATRESFFPRIEPVGISCPSNAPQIRVSSLASRMDIEFSEVVGADKYEIEIVDYYGVMVRLEIPAPANRAEWYGPVNLYRVRVRTINCGGLGNWSEEVVHALNAAPAPPRDEPPVEPPPIEPPPIEPPPIEPPPGPQCMTFCF